MKLQRRTSVRLFLNLFKIGDGHQIMSRDIAKVRMRKSFRSVACTSVITAIVCLSALFVTIVPADESDATEGTLGSLIWVLDGNTLTIIGEGEMYDFTEYELSRDWNLEDVVTVVIGDNITSIGDYVFRNHVNLENLVIGKDVVDIGVGSFQLCSKLKSVYLPDSVRDIGEQSFADCTGMTDISFSSVTLIGPNAFRSIIFDDDSSTAIGHTVSNLSGKKFVKNNVSSHLVLEGWRVSFDSKGGSSIDNLYVPNGNPLMPPDDPTKDGFTFDKWCTDESCENPYVFSNPVTGPLKLYAKWNAAVITHQVKFVSEGVDFKVYLLSIGDTITAPSEIPTKASDSKYEYRFSHWDGYTPNMALTTEGATFNAVFDKMIKMNKDGSRLSLADNEASKMDFSSDRIDMIVTMANTDSELTMTVNLENCMVFFDNAALRSLKVADAELSVSKMSYDDLTSAQKKVIGNRTAYEMKFGDNTDFKGGKVKFTVDYAIEDGKSADDLYVAYISDGKVQEEIECDYGDGKLSFSTGHLSVYTFFYKEAKKTGFLADLDLGSFLTIGIIFAIALSGIILFVLKKIK